MPMLAAVFCRDAKQKNMVEGQKVVCISEDFPVIKSTAEDKSDEGRQAPSHPIKGETLIINEMLWDFLRFDKYDNHNQSDPNYGWNWWHNSRFKPLDEIEITSEVFAELGCVPNGS